ncbi:hypothetical protein [Gordonia sp. CNJ-863]|uniref:hypothetical protein n=1 Tax=Gordonia sp. CNJ-863 TaxID=1904963 RepID=UPI0011151528|nr:hypothetical protein [Gordonia sp. CNJ-863]
MVDVLSKPVGVYMMTLWWHSRGDEAANAELADILTALGFLDATAGMSVSRDRSAAVHAATEDDTARELLAQWCIKTRARRGGAGVQHPLHWLSRATAAMAAETDPDAVNRQHRLVFDMVTNLPPTDAADPAVSEQIAEHFHTYNTHAIHQGRSPGR